MPYFVHGRVRICVSEYDLHRVSAMTQSEQIERRLDKPRGSEFPVSRFT